MNVKNLAAFGDIVGNSKLIVSPFVVHSRPFKHFSSKKTLTYYTVSRKQHSFGLL